MLKEIRVNATCISDIHVNYSKFKLIYKILSHSVYFQYTPILIEIIEKRNINKYCYFRNLHTFIIATK